jgi:hypothetical protein
VAKQLATQFGVAIDMPAGPSELLIVADVAAFYFTAQGLVLIPSLKARTCTVFSFLHPQTVVDES